MSECKHEKVYSNRIIPSNPPQVQWICRKCGEMGTEWLGSYGHNDYDELRKKFEEKKNEQNDKGD